MATREHVQHHSTRRSGPTVLHATIVAAIALVLGFFSMPAANAVMAMVAGSGS